ncbi:MAG: AraC family transcriptional regulator [Bacteroidota bacterium]|nr:AraC family transcriptional regulator [Bacteroidota bacterium]
MAFSIKKWLSSFQKYLFYYRDGFYELPYVANSPELITETFHNMPFVKSSRKNGTYYCNNPFLKGDGHYHKLEEGLWIIMSQFEIKQNLSFRMYYEPGIPSEYHFLSLYLNRGTRTLKLPKMHIDVECIDRSWMLFKAGHNCLNSHFKGQKSLFLTILFSKEWMKQNIASNGVLKNKTLEDFFHSELESLFLPNFLERKREVYEILIESILNKDENGVKDLLLVKRNTLEILSYFIQKLDDEAVHKASSNTPEKDMRKAIKAEYIITNSIFDTFPSIQNIAKEVGISETKLMADFKQVYGCSMYQYFSLKQMNYAKEILKKRDIPVKEVAYSLGYSNTSKFSAAFKKAHGHLPSEV